MSIPDKAVEAAAQVIALSTGHIMESDWEWEHLPKGRYYETAREALEAAAPHMLAEAWADAFKKGSERGAWEAAPVTKEPHFTNPYRSQA